MDIFKYLQILEKQERILAESSKVKYDEADLDAIKDILKKGKKIKDARLLSIYNKLKDAGIFE